MRGGRGGRHERGGRFGRGGRNQPNYMHRDNASDLPSPPVELLQPLNAASQSAVATGPAAAGHDGNAAADQQSAAVGQKRGPEAEQSAVGADLPDAKRARTEAAGAPVTPSAGEALSPDHRAAAGGGWLLGSVLYATLLAALPDVMQGAIGVLLCREGHVYCYTSALSMAMLLAA